MFRKGDELVLFNKDNGKIVVVKVVRVNKSFSVVLWKDRELKIKKDIRGDWTIQDFSGKIYEMAVYGTSVYEQLSNKYEVIREEFRIKKIKDEIIEKNFKIKTKLLQVDNLKEEIKKLEEQLQNKEV